MMETDFSASSICNNIDQDELLKSAKAKMGEVREENEKLKKLLAQIAMDYKSLEKQISSMAPSTIETNSSDNNNKEVDHLVSLTLGSWTSNKKSCDDDTKKRQSNHDASNKRRKIDGGGLELGLDNYCKLEKYVVDASASDSMKNSALEENKEEENSETLSPCRGQIKPKEKTVSPPKEGDEESLHQPQMKKTRVCIRSRCDTPTMNDGCQWRKYGQKISKGNPCPRAYYRCTISSSCPVRKQVQRCADDMSILITTYEGNHNHPLPLSATAMASATSAAASMLKSGSITSQSTLVGPTNHPATTSSSFGLHSSTLMYPFNTNARLSIPNPSMISSSSHSHPTITLDLTTPNSGLGPTPFNWLSSSSLFSNNNNNNNSSRKNSSNFLNFSSSSPSSSSSLDFTTSNNAPATSTSWASGYFNYGSSFPFNNNNSNSNSNNNNVNNIMNTRHMNYQNPSNSQQQQSLNETIAAVATKAIASNPNFQSVLAAAISSYVGNNNNKASNIEAKKSSSPTSNSQPQGGSSSLMLFPTSSPLPVSKNNASAADASKAS